MNNLFLVLYILEALLIGRIASFPPESFILNTVTFQVISKITPALFIYKINFPHQTKSQRYQSYARVNVKTRSFAIAHSISASIGARKFLQKVHSFTVAKVLLYLSLACRFHRVYRLYTITR